MQINILDDLHHFFYTCVTVDLKCWVRKDMWYRIHHFRDWTYLIEKAQTVLSLCMCTCEGIVKSITYYVAGVSDHLLLGVEGDEW